MRVVLRLGATPRQFAVPARGESPSQVEAVRRGESRLERGVMGNEADAGELDRPRLLVVAEDFDAPRGR